MASSDQVEMVGIVEEVCRGGHFKVRCKLGENEHIVLAYPSGKMRKFGINIVLGDVVKVEVSPYSLDKGRIIFRNK